jgi:hypothetical protein
MKMLTRQGVLIEDMGQTYLAEPDADGDEVRRLGRCRLRLSPIALPSGLAPGRRC